MRTVIRPAAGLLPGDTFVYRASPNAEPAVVEVVRTETLHRTGRVRVWAYRQRASRSFMTPFIAGTFGVGATVEVPDGARP